jgi:hypothetical protein
MSEAQSRTGKKKPPVDPEIKNYWAILPENKFMHAPSRTMLVPEVIDKMFGNGTSSDLIQVRGCMQLTWAPGLPMVVEDKCIVNGEWIDSKGQRVFNWYLPPTIRDVGDPEQAEMWLDLGNRMWGDQLDHMLDVLAFKVQNPDIKVNHALVLGSYGQGVGKDSWLHPVGYAVGRHNWRNVSAGRAFTEADRFNSFLENVVVQISEAHDLGDKRFSFYDKMKDWCAAPPNTLEVANKNVKAHPIANVVLPIITTNHKTDGLFWPMEDRRNYFAWSSLGTMAEDYRRALWAFYKGDGCNHVAAYLRARDVSAFDPYAPPPKTDAWYAVASANTLTEDTEMADVLDNMGDVSFLGEDRIFRPQAITVEDVRAAAKRMTGGNDLYNFLSDRRNSRKIAHRFESAGYTVVRNPDDAKGQWRFAGTRRMIYADARLSSQAQRSAVQVYMKAEIADAKRGGKAAYARPDTDAEPDVG